jgi:hypothetical protein
MDKAKYSMRIEWSEEDQCYVVSLPEFTHAMQPVTFSQREHCCRCAMASLGFCSPKSYPSATLKPISAFLPAVSGDLSC